MRKRSLSYSVCVSTPKDGTDKPRGECQFRRQFSITEYNSMTTATPGMSLRLKNEKRVKDESDLIRNKSEMAEKIQTTGVKDIGGLDDQDTTVVPCQVRDGASIRGIPGFSFSASIAPGKAGKKTRGRVSDYRNGGTYLNQKSQGKQLEGDKAVMSCKQRKPGVNYIQRNKHFSSMPKAHLNGRAEGIGIRNEAVPLVAPWKASWKSQLKANTWMNKQQHEQQFRNESRFVNHKEHVLATSGKYAPVTLDCTVSPLPTENVYLILSTLENKHNSLKHQYAIDQERNIRLIAQLKKGKAETSRLLSTKQSKLEALSNEFKQFQSSHYLKLEDHLSKIRDLETQKMKLHKESKAERNQRSHELALLNEQLAEKNSKVTELEDLNQLLSKAECAREAFSDTVNPREAKEYESLKALTGDVDQMKLDHSKAISEKQDLVEKNDQLSKELSQSKASLFLKDIECEKLRSETVLVNKKFLTVLKELSALETTSTQQKVMITQVTAARDSALAKSHQLERDSRQFQLEGKKVGMKLKHLAKENEEIVSSHKTKLDTISNLRQEVDQMAREKKVLNSKLHRSQNETKSLQKTISSLQAKVEVQNEQIENIREALETTKQTYKALEVENDTLLVGVETLRKKVKVDEELKNTVDFDEFKEVMAKNQALAAKFTQFLENNHTQC